MTSSIQTISDFGPLILMTKVATNKISIITCYCITQRFATLDPRTSL